MYNNSKIQESQTCTFNDFHAKDKNARKTKDPGVTKGPCDASSSENLGKNHHLMDSSCQSNQCENSKKTLASLLPLSRVGNGD